MSETTEKLPCDECDNTYKDANGILRCAMSKARTEGYFAADTCLERHYYYPKSAKPVGVDRTLKFDIFE